MSKKKKVKRLKKEIKSYQRHVNKLLNELASARAESARMRSHYENLVRYVRL